MMYRLPKKKTRPGIIPVWAKEKPEITNHADYIRATAKLFGGKDYQSKVETARTSKAGVLAGDLCKETGHEANGAGDKV